MDIVIGSGDNRKVVTFANGAPIRKMEREQPLEYVKSKGFIMERIRQGG